MATTKKPTSVKKTPQAKKPVVKIVEPKKETNTTKGMVTVFSLTGEKTGEITLPSIFTGSVNTQLIAQARRVYLANQREGSAATKTRSFVEGSTRKIYKQKGTGRARQGSIRANIFVGGGIVFGPQPRDFSLTLSKSMRQEALKSAFVMKANEQGLSILDGTMKEPKTKTVSACLTKMGITRRVVLVTDDMHGALAKSARNITTVTVRSAVTVTTYDVVIGSHVIFTKEALKQVEQRLA